MQKKINFDVTNQSGTPCMYPAHCRFDTLSLFKGCRIWTPDSLTCHPLISVKSLSYIANKSDKASSESVIYNTIYNWVDHVIYQNKILKKKSDFLILKVYYCQCHYVCDKENQSDNEKHESYFPCDCKILLVLVHGSRNSSFIVIL